jgi:hypothetical protein
MDAFSVSISVGLHQVPILNKGVIECYDIHIAQVFDIVATREIRRLSPLASSGSKLHSGHGESNTEHIERGFNSPDFIKQNLVRTVLGVTGELRWK